MKEDIAERVKTMCDDVLESWEDPIIEVKYHEGASKLGSDVHGVMCDMAASETVELKQGECKVIPLGVSMKLQEGCWGLLVPRSSTCLKHGIMMANSVGVVEPDYCGDDDVWGFVAYAIRDTTIEQGTRIAQFMPIPLMVRWDSIRFKELDSMPYPNRGGYGSTGEKAGKHVLDCAGNPIYAGSYVHTVYGNETKRVAQVFAEGEAFELESGTVIDERNSEKSEKILYQDGGWDRATSVYVVNDTMSDALGTISCLERENMWLKVENEQLKAEIERLKSEVPGDCMKLPVDVDGVPIEVGDAVYPLFDGELQPGTEPWHVARIKNGEEFYAEEATGFCSARYFTHRKPDSWEKLEEDAKMVKACDYAHAPRDEYGITVCRDCRFQKSKSCRQEMILDMIARAKRLAVIEEQEGE